MTQAAANDTGLRAGIPVVFGGADQPMQAIGNGIIHPGTISCTIGTGGQLFTPINRPIYDKQLRTHTFVHAVPDTWYLLGATMSAGLSLKWLANKILNNEDYKALDVKAGAVPAGSDHLIFLPYLTGDRTPHMDPHARAMFFGLTLGHNDAHMIRSVLEGVAYSLRDSLEIFKSLGVSAERVIISGGGARSKLWSQILADILNTDVHVSTTQEQACVGAALLAGVATKAYESIEDACSRVVTIKDTPIQPDSDNRALYDEHYNIYKELYERNNHLFPRL